MENTGCGTCAALGAINNRRQKPGRTRRAVLLAEKAQLPKCRALCGL